MLSFVPKGEFSLLQLSAISRHAHRDEQSFSKAECNKCTDGFLLKDGGRWYYDRCKTENLHAGQIVLLLRGSENLVLVNLSGEMLITAVEVDSERMSTQPRQVFSQVKPHLLLLAQHHMPIITCHTSKFITISTHLHSQRRAGAKRAALNIV